MSGGEKGGPLLAVPEFLAHHPFLGSDAEGDKESHRDAVGRARGAPFRR
jgi:hypothetical protein